MFYTKTHIDILPKLYDSFKIRLTAQEMQVWTLGQEDTPEKMMGTHSSTHACGIPWTEEL